MAAEVSHQDPTSSRWRLEVRSDGMILLSGASSRWVMGSIEAALENVSKVEAEKRCLAGQAQGSLIAGALGDGLLAELPGV